MSEDNSIEEIEKTMDHQRSGSVTKLMAGTAVSFANSNIMMDQKMRVKETNANIDTEKEGIEEKNSKTEDEEELCAEIHYDDKVKPKVRDSWKTSGSILGYLKVHLTSAEIHSAKA
jgi:hypothetical protein